MSVPMYVSPEQFVKDRAEFARKGVARGRPVAVLVYEGGIVLITENPARSLRKISEIYDSIAFAAVGNYTEFEQLRVAGIRYADLRGYSYARIDVTAHGLVAAYAQTLSAAFAEGFKPYEVEIAIAELGENDGQDLLFRIACDGAVSQEHNSFVMGGQAEELGAELAKRWRPGLPLADAVRLGTDVVSMSGQATMKAGCIEAAVLERSAPRRHFRRLTDADIARAGHKPEAKHDG